MGLPSNSIIRIAVFASIVAAGCGSFATAQEPDLGALRDDCGTRETYIFIPAAGPGSSGRVQNITVPVSCPVTGGMARLVAFVEAEARPLLEDCEAVLAQGRQESPTHYFVHEFVLPEDTHLSLETFRAREVGVGREPETDFSYFRLYRLLDFALEPGPYSMRELVCWSQRGDQLAAQTVYEYGHARPTPPYSQDAYRHLMAINRGYERTLADRGIHLLRASVDAGQVCDLFSDAATREAPECSASGMLAVTRHGVAMAHFELYEILENSERFADRDAALNELRLAAEAGHSIAWAEYHDRTGASDAGE